MQALRLFSILGALAALAGAVVAAQALVLSPAGPISFGPGLLGWTSNAVKLALGF